MLNSSQTENFTAYPVEGVTFFGSSSKVIEAINSVAPVRVIVTESRHFNVELYNLINLRKIKLIIIHNTKEYRNIADEVSNQLGISYGFGMIFKEADIQKFKHGIWNIHAGKLPDIRGRHPISWGFLRNDFQFWASIHEINHDIDQGFLLAEDYVHRNITDTSVDIEEKLERLLTDKLIVKAFENYFSGSRKSLSQGNYYKSLIGKFDDFKPEELDSDYVFNAFKSQIKYGGIQVNNKIYKECVFVNEDFVELYSKYAIFMCRDNVKIGLY